MDDVEYSDDIEDTPIAAEDDEKDEDLYLKAMATVLVREELHGEPVEFHLPKDKIKPPKPPKEPASNWPPLIIGFDTEYQSLKPFYADKDVKNKQAKYEVLSYQFYTWAKETAVDGIVIPNPNQRISFTEFIVYAAAKFVATTGDLLPRSIILVGHFNKADFPAFSDRDQVFRKLRNIRNSLVSGFPVAVRVFYSNAKDDYIELKVYVRDSILMAPAGERSLAAVGELLGISKMKLANDPTLELDLKRNMKSVRENMWPRFKEYAILDAEISAKYFDAMMKLYRRTTGTSKIPTSLSNIGINLLQKGWKKREIDRLDVVGKESIKEAVWNDDTDNFFTLREEQYVEELSWYIDFGTECYHGGRSEQLWFGPSFEDNWSDYDLAGAYPTAMATIGNANWHGIYPTTDLKKLRLGSFGFACVDFKFPDNVRYPTLPVRTGRGIVFPLEGRSYCSSPEIEVALNLGCKLIVRHGVVIPHDDSEKIFRPFIAETIELRETAGPSLEKAFWKEITNSCYGKTAQGLRAKRVYNLKKMRTVQIPQSPITNPFFAAYITSMVRAVVGEIMNAIPENKIVFSVTTDGFLTNANDSEIQEAIKGPLCALFAESRKQISNKSDVLTKKHAVKQLLGWRTRGQATLKFGEQIDTKQYVLAKAGLRSPNYTSTMKEQNDYILKIFFERVAGRKFDADVPTSMKDLMIFNADFVRKERPKTASMEYDFKRRPEACDIIETEHGRHVAFSTKPWRSVEEFKNVRAVWENVYRTAGLTLKTIDDCVAFAEFYDAKHELKESNKHRYFKSDLNRLNRDLCAAYGNSEAGLADLGYTAAEFASLLNDCGFGGTGNEVKRANVEYGRKAEFVPNATPRTAAVAAILSQLQVAVPTFDPLQILIPKPKGQWRPLSEWAENRLPQAQ